MIYVLFSLSIPRAMFILYDRQRMRIETGVGKRLENPPYFDTNSSKHRFGRVCIVV